MSADQIQLAALLTHLTGGATHTPTTEEIRDAEAKLKPILKKQESVPALMGLLGDLNQPAPIRQVSAIVLRKRISSHYGSFAAPDQAALRASLIAVLTTEPERSVRLSTCAVAASIASLVYIDGDPPTGWPELLGFINTSASGPSPDARELAYSILGELTETVGDHLRPQFPNLSAMYGTALADSSAPRVQGAALKSLGQLVSYLSDEAEEDGSYPIDPFANLIPVMLNAGAACVTRGDDDEIMVLCDVLYDLVRCNATSVAAHMPSMVAFCVSCIADDTLEMSARDSAGLVIASYAEGKPKQLGRAGVIPGILDMLMGLIQQSADSSSGALFDSNPAWREDHEEDEEYEGPTATSMAQGTLDMIACHVPMKFIFQPAMERIVARVTSQQPEARKAGIASLGVIAEGCSEPIREHLGEIMGHVFTAAADPDPQVRECTCFALGQLAEHCRPEILEYADRVLPVTFALLDDPNAAVQTTSCYVLEMFCEQLEPLRVRPFLESLVTKLVTMLQTSTRRSVQEMSVAALAATAVAAETEFTPYVPGVVAVLEKLMQSKDEKLVGLRGRALECMGHIAIAVERDAFRPYFAGTMACACEGLTTDNTDLHEFAYAAFANLSKVMGDEFTPCIAELVPHLLKVIGTGDELAEAEKEEAKQEAFNLGDSDDEEGDDFGRFIMNVRTALIDTKKAAITAIGEIAAHCGAAFMPYLEQATAVLATVAGYWHPLIKAECAEALPSMLIPSIAANHAGKVAWEKGNVTGPNPMSEHTNNVCSAVIGMLVELISDEEKEVVAKACEGIQQVIELCGPYALVPVATDCLQRTLDLMSLQAPCQADDEEFDEEVDDHDSFMTSVTDLIGGYGRVMGQQFAPFVERFLPPICAFAKSSRPPSDRAMAMGCLGEIVQEVEGGVSAHWDTVFLPAVLAGLADEELNVKRNSAFCVGACCSGFGPLAVPSYPTLLQSLSPLFAINATGNDAAGACIDNAVAAVCRMIMASPENMPIGQVLPPLLKNLPLKSDYSENKTVYDCVLGLVDMKHPDIVANGEALTVALRAAVLPDAEVSDEIKARVTAALGGMQ